MFFTVYRHFDNVHFEIVFPVRGFEIFEEARIRFSQCAIPKVSL